MKSRKFKGELYIINLYNYHLENYHSYGGAGFYGVNTFNDYLHPSHLTGKGYYNKNTEDYDINLIYGTSKI